MKNEETTLDEVVENGARLLDQENPTWASKINIEALDMHACGECILGQLYNYYDRGMEALFNLCDEEDDAFEKAFDYGFDCTTMELGEITELWKNAIQSRLETT